MIKSKFRLFQVQQKFLDTKSVKFLYPAFGERPEAFDPVDVIRSISQLIVGVIDTKMFRETDINQSVVIAPRIRVNNHLGDFTADNRLRR